MIEYTKGNILKADVEAVVNTVNCVGVMGRGIALQFKKQYEDNFKAYKRACDDGEMELGKMFVFDRGSFLNPRYIINFPTKGHWRGKSKLRDIEVGLQSLVEEVQSREIESIAIPALGCGLGGLDWSDVSVLIETAFEGMEHVQVVLFDPGKAPAAKQMAKSAKVPNMTNCRASLVVLIKRYLEAVMDPFVSLLEVHKLMYFLAEVGEPVENLKFTKGIYGPYSENLRHVLNVTENHFTSGFADGEDNPSKPIELLSGAVDKANGFLERETETVEHVNRVADLIDGFETPFGMELLATVHWVAHKEEAISVELASEQIQKWNVRKKKYFKPKYVELAWGVLGSHGLLPKESTDQ